MQRSRLRLAAAFVAIGALTSVAAGCGSSSKSGANGSTTTTAPPGPPPVTITAGDYSFQNVPKTMTAGLETVKFVNKGAVQHEMVFVKVKPGTTDKALFTALAQTVQGGPTPAFALAVDGVYNVDPDKTVVTKFNLTSGDYVALCTDTGVAGSTKDGPPHFSRGMHARITVTGPGGATPPTAAASIVAHDYGFVLNGLKAGDQTIAFRNTGPEQWHFADVNVFPKGVTVAQAKQAIQKLLASGNGPPPAGVPMPTEVVSSQIASPGQGSTFQANLLAGRTYIVLCFASDKTGGPPHAIGHHMFKIFTVS